MKCYEEDDFGYDGAEIPCDPSLPVEMLQWMGVTLAGLVVLFVALAILGAVHDWVVNRYIAQDETPTTPTSGSVGPML
jgi:multisubunit Na+/H+ antiporter MnhB subunit